MDKQQIEKFLEENGKKFPEPQLGHIRKHLEGLDEARSHQAMATKFWDPIILLVVSVLLGYLAVDRFMLGDKGKGFLKLITCGGCCFWWIIDCISVMKNTKEANYRKIMSI